MLNRRHFLTTSLLLSAGGLLGMERLLANTDTTWRMPDEGEPHTRTWMAFGASEAIWGKKLLPETRRSLALIATTIAKYEPVSLLVRESERAMAEELIQANPKISLVTCPINDLWIRDTGSTFVVNDQNQKAAVNFNFNGWGNKQEHKLDAKVAAFVAQKAGVKALNTSLIMEGGCIEVDGHGTAIITESCVLNKNRNPKVSKAQFEDLLMPLLGLDKIIWLPGIKGKDITDGHTDFYARFARPGVVLAGYDPDPQSYDHEITLRHLELLKSATDAQGKKLQIITLEAPTDIRTKYLNNEFASGYIGFYVCNGAVIMQEFGDKAADSAARAAIQKAFPERKIEQLNVDGIAAGGGSIHCATQQEPA
ncbi:agmatine deiminase family protein [Thiofilum flexile]|uniref:agmatine deiminase family protein n=1 Tax=Thiofilum flexile TaxID=125627 RepID=UPI00036F6F3D|nr:agmatine deiminase family protein [Thiofilum flexile]